MHSIFVNKKTVFEGLIRKKIRNVVTYPFARVTFADMII